MKNILLFTFIVFLSCNSQQGIERSKKNTTSKIENSIRDITEEETSKTEIIETFVDSTNIGDKGKYKVELIKYRILNDSYVIIQFYMKWDNKWIGQNKYFYECDAIQDLSPIFEDYNNDNFNDMTFISATAARSANEVRRLFIFNEKNRELISILNSESYPNLLYNNELNCIDAFLVYGGSSTVFARIKKDSLIEFASVHNDNYRTVYEIDQFGKEKLLSRDTIIDFENIYVRYINYKPLKEYNYKN